MSRRGASGQPVSPGGFSNPIEVYRNGIRDFYLSPPLREYQPVSSSHDYARRRSLSNERIARRPVLLFSFAYPSDLHRRRADLKTCSSLNMTFSKYFDGETHV